MKEKTKDLRERESLLFPSPQADPAEPKTTLPRGHHSHKKEGERKREKKRPTFIVC